MIRFVTLAVVVLATSSATACPFCSAVSQTFSEEMGSMDVVAICRLKNAAKIANLEADSPQAEVPKSRFVISQVIKGKDFINVGDTFDTVYFGEPKKDRPFLAMATDAPNLMWSTPLILSDRAAQYLQHVHQLPPGAERLEFFQDYLEDEDEMLARDAYDEFAKAPYKDVILLKSKMDRDRLLKFIQDKDVPSNRRRLYFTMLGVCGHPEDAVLLEQLMKSSDRKDKAGLDAMLACYMILAGEKSLEHVDELFLKNKDAEYADTYAAIMAIRFHGSETNVIPRTRLVSSLRHMLDRPELADLVIPDLARWEDWEIMPKLVELFLNADENSSWVRVPVVNYLRACPDPAAKAKIEELKAVDADAVNRAMTFFPLGAEQPGTSGADTKSGDAAEQPSESSQPPQPNSTSALDRNAADRSALTASRPTESQGTVSVEGEVAEVPASVVNQERRLPVPALATRSIRVETPATMKQVEATAEEGLNPWALLGVTFISGGVCLAAMRTVLGVGR